MIEARYRGPHEYEWRFLTITAALSASRLTCAATTLYRNCANLAAISVNVRALSDEAKIWCRTLFSYLHRTGSGGSQENIRSVLFRRAHNGAGIRQQSYDRFRQTTRSRLDSISDDARRNQVVLEKEKLRRLERRSSY